uniref:Uncharacterized protein n=1 Tax=viral metagenome TaxID=1070528 RepID=A0A6M3XSR1_9ZZZZ
MLRWGDLAHLLMGMAIVFGLRQGFPRLKVWISVLIVVAVAITWEYGLQNALASVIPWWDPAPDVRQAAMFCVGGLAAAATVAFSRDRAARDGNTAQKGR